MRGLHASSSSHALHFTPGVLAVAVPGATPHNNMATVALLHRCASKVHQVDVHPTLPWVAAADKADVVVVDRITGRRVMELGSLEAARVQVSASPHTRVKWEVPLYLPGTDGSNCAETSATP